MYKRQITQGVFVRPDQTELCNKINNEIKPLIPDRTFIEDGTRWIIDYKTSTHEGSRLSEFIASEIERYSDQLNKYAVIYQNFSQKKPKVALYFPNFKLLKRVMI